MGVSVIVGVFGDESWSALAHERAIPSAEGQAPVVFSRGESLADCRNRGAERAESEWLLFLDADDELAPGAVDALARASGDLRIPATSYVRRGIPAEPMFWPQNDIRDTNYLVVSTLIRRDLFWEVGGFQDCLCYEDWLLFGAAVKSGATVEQVPGAVLRVHVNPRSLHRGGSSRAFKQRAHEQVRRMVWPELYEEAACPSPA